MIVNCAIINFGHVRWTALLYWDVWITLLIINLQCLWKTTQQMWLKPNKVL